MIDSSGLDFVTRVRRRLRTLAPSLRQRHAEWSWQRTLEHLPAHLQDIATRLGRDGIAVTDVAALGMQSDFDTLRKNLHEMVGADGAPTQHWCGRGNGSGPSDMYSLRGNAAWLVAQADVHARLALNPSVLRIVNDYLGCYARLNHYDAWLNTPSTGRASGSQLWHRDVGTHSMVKMYILANEVTERNGAFVYMLGSQPGGPYADVEAQGVHDGRAARTDDESVRTAAPDATWLTASGPPGTVILADTRGYHKGGYVLAGHRLQFMSFYTRRDYYRPPRVLVSKRGIPRCTTSQSWAIC